ncbi:MAG: hypothetical protein HGA55_04855, partial [Methanoregulaceae archaeon]|nr:hypothetical protein [Methanoregulaceae archaeon]
MKETGIDFCPGYGPDRAGMRSVDPCVDRARPPGIEDDRVDVKLRDPFIRSK